VHGPGALELARTIGLGDAPMLWFAVHLSSRQRNHNGVSRYQGSIRVDSRDATWFHVYLAGVGGTLDRKHSLFGAETRLRDTLRLGRCAPHELPDWLARTAKTLRHELALAAAAHAPAR